MKETDLIIKNVRIYDGTGGPSFFGAVAVTGGKITAVKCAESFSSDGPDGSETNIPDTGSADFPADISAERVVDGKGLALAPGFIDSHSHADEVIFADPGREHVLRMGVTTEVAGQCGHTESPYPADVDPQLFSMASGCWGGRPYQSFGELSRAAEELPLGTNQAWFTGHGALRTWVMGFENRKATEEEICRMRDLLKKEMEGGALGFSTGLAYVPGIYSDADELSGIALGMKEFGGIYTSHTRSESAGLFDAVRECIEVGRRAGVRANISHFKACYPDFWDRMDEALSLVDKAAAEGVEITFDAYPYTAVSTTTLSAMPAKFLTGGAEAFAKSLEDPSVVEAVRREIYEVDDPGWDNALKHAGPDRFLVVGAGETPEFEGMSYTQIAEKLRMEPFDAVIWMLRKNRGRITDVRFIMTEENVEKVLAHPLCTVGSDGIWKKGLDRVCHPRAFGTFPRYLGHYIRERKILSREEGIRRITSLPAQRYGLSGKGQIRPGYDADLVLFDYDRILDGGDFKDPFRPNTGITEVWVAGKTAVKDDRPAEAGYGRFLRRNSK